MCGWTNCNYNKEDIVRIVVGVNNQAPKVLHAPTAAEDSAAALAHPKFVLRRIESPPKGDGQSDICRFMLSKSNPASNKATDSSASISPETPATKQVAKCHSTPNPTEKPPMQARCGDTKPAARAHPEECDIFIKRVCGEQTTYHPVEKGVLKRDKLPRGIALLFDLDGPDPSRTILELEQDAGDIPDFVLDAIAAQDDLTTIYSTPQEGKM